MMMHITIYCLNAMGLAQCLEINGFMIVIVIETLSHAFKRSEIQD